MIKILQILFIVMFFVCSCKKVNYELPQKSPVGIGATNAYVLETRYVSHLADKLFIETDIGIVYSGGAIDHNFMPDSAFQNASFGNHQVIIESVEKIQLYENKSYSNLIVMDMSKDWNEIDLFNLRTRALHKSVLETLENPANKVGLGTFRRDEYGVSQNFTHIRSVGSAYQQTKENLGSILLDWYYEEMGGTSNLYDGLDSFLEYANTRSFHQNKYITIITRGIPDNQNTVNYIDIINKALSYNIKINCVIIGNDFNWNMVRLACQTGGFINLITSTSDYTLTNGGLMDKGTPMLGSFHRPLSKNVHIYRVKMKLQRTSGVWISGNVLFDYYQSNIRFSDGSNRLNNYLPIYVSIP